MRDGVGGVVAWLGLAGGIFVGYAGCMGYGARQKVCACAHGGILFDVWWVGCSVVECMWFNMLLYHKLCMLL